VEAFAVVAPRGTLDGPLAYFTYYAATTRSLRLWASMDGRAHYGRTRQPIPAHQLDRVEDPAAARVVSCVVERATDTEEPDARIQSELEWTVRVVSESGDRGLSGVAGAAGAFSHQLASRPSLSSLDTGTNNHTLKPSAIHAHSTANSSRIPQQS